MNVRWHINVCLVKLAISLLRLTRWYDGYWNHWRTMFPLAERQGLHIMPVHYYSPIPDARELPEALWTHNRAPVGVDLNIDTALVQLDRFNQNYSSEYNAFPAKPSDNAHDYHLNNEAYFSGDAEILYSMVRELKPKRIIEIGSGYSTLLICQAIRINQKETSNYQCDFIAIEPYPPPALIPPPAEVTRMESKPLQQISPELFASLSVNDILFIDSTHVVRIGSDVALEFLTIVPNLAPGVVVHIHDIFIPAEYPRQWIEQARFFWNEQYLIEAFLAFNEEFEVIMATHAIWLAHADYLRKVIPSLDKGRPQPSSFWIRRCQSK